MEVKARAVISTLGQLIGYRVLFLEGFRNMGDPKLLCVCGSITKDVKFVFAMQGIPFEVV